ncbi:MAG: hypothetical protein CV087_09600 [Candidatus Brocadia sp. WS118]|nr:MAG: hypothetical protein CV087_09600 [Candidatus Brocadia sp. WS118]
MLIMKSDYEFSVQRLENDKQVFTPTLLELWRDFYSHHRRYGVHVSSLCNCPRKSVYEELSTFAKDKRFKIYDGKEYEWITEITMKRFKVGSAVHKEIQADFRRRDPQRYEIEKSVMLGDLTGSIDIYDNFLDVVYDIKTSTEAYSTVYLNGPKKAYVNQIASYIAMIDASYGILYYQFLGENNERNIHLEFKVSLTTEQKEEWRKMLLEKVANYKMALEQKNPNLAEGCYNDKELVTICKNYCPFADSCQCAEGYAIKCL